MTKTSTNTRIQNLFFVLALFAGVHRVAAQTSFALSTNYVVGLNPQWITAADINRDGKVDLISANVSDDTLTVLTNNGSGVFGSNATLRVGPQPVCVAAFTNVDGYVDLVCANRGGTYLTLLTNNGGGIFTSNTSFTVGANPVCVTVADMNNDGKPDLICANYGSRTLSVLTNNGLGGFGSNYTCQATNGVGNTPNSVLAMDVNGDGKMDLICVNYDNNDGTTLSVMTNDGLGGFALAYQPAVAKGPYAIITADINGDGKMVLICVSEKANSVAVLTNGGSGNFVISGPDYPVGFAPLSVVAADVNGDNKLDLICANANSGTLSVLTNNGSGMFALATVFNVGMAPNSVAVADVNGDGKPDLISANTGANTLTLFTNTSVFPTIPLSIASVGNQTILFWPATATNYILQSTTNLSSTNWVPVTDAVPVIAVTVSNTAPARFFRLEKHQ